MGKLALQMSVNPGTFEQGMLQAAQDVQKFSRNAATQLGAISQPAPIHANVAPFLREVAEAKKAAESLSMGNRMAGQGVSSAPAMMTQQMQLAQLQSQRLYGSLGQVNMAFSSLAGLNFQGPLGQLGSLAGTLGSIASTGISGFAVGIIAAGGALVTFASSAMRAIAAQAGLAKRFGITTEAAAGLQFAAARFGVDQETLGGGLALLARKLGEIKSQLNSGGGGEMLTALRRLKIDAAGFLALPMDQQLAQLSQGLVNVHDPLERAEIGFRILGRQYEQLEPLLRRGAAAFADSAAMVKLLGLATSAVDAKNIKAALAAAKEAGAFLASIVQSVGASIGIGIAPAMRAMSEAAKALVLGIQPALQIIRDLFRAVAEAVSFVVTAVIDGVSPIASALGTVAKIIGDAWTKIVSVFTAVGSALSPIKSLLSGLVSIVAFFVSAAVTGALLVRTLALVRGAVLALQSAFLAITTATEIASVGLVAFRTTLISTGVGALIVGLGLLINYFSSTQTAASGAADEMGRLRAIAANPAGNDAAADTARQLIAARLQAQELQARLADAGMYEAPGIARQVEATGALIARLREQLAAEQQIQGQQEITGNMLRTADIRMAERAAMQAFGYEEQIAAAQRLREVLARPVTITGPEAAQRLKQSIQEVTVALHEHIATAGMSADALARWRLLQQGATAADLARIEALQGVAAAAQEAAKLKADGDALAVRQDDAAATFGMSAREAEIARLAARGLNEEKLEQLRLQNLILEGLEAQAKLEGDARRVAESVLPPLEKQAREQAHLQEMVEKGLLSQDEYDLALMKSFEDMSKGERGMRIMLPGALEEGSKEAISAVNQALVRGLLGAKKDPTDRVVDAIARLEAQQKQQVLEAREVRRVLERINPPVI